MLITLHVWRVPRRHLGGALRRMATEPWRLRRLPGVRFAKLLGTGTGTGFGPGDVDLTRWAALVVWDDDPATGIGNGDPAADGTGSSGPTSATRPGDPTTGTGNPGPTPATRPSNPTPGTGNPGPTPGTKPGNPTTGTGNPGPTPGTKPGNPTTGTGNPGPTPATRPGNPPAGTGNADPTPETRPGTGDRDPAPVDARVAAVERSWAAVADASARVDLAPLTSRGTWSGREPFGNPHGGRTDGMVLALTRARLRPARAVRFWRAIPPVAAELAAAPGLLARFGVGEAPVGWQGTVSVWRGAADLNAFAYRQPEHRAVIARTPADRWYAEELFARFAVRGISGDPAVLGWTQEERERS